MVGNCAPSSPTIVIILIILNENQMKENKVYTPPLEWDENKRSVYGGLGHPVRIFLGGTIDNGNSEDWQSEVIKSVNNISLQRQVYFYNPRRENWPSADNHREIGKQIDWELFHLEKSDRIFMNILASSKSPISLMEIGLFARTGKLIVFCPKSFYRYDNVMKICEKYNVTLYTTNNIEYITKKICEYVGIDEKAEKEKLKISERESLLKMKENCKLPDGTISEWYSKLFEEEKKRFEEEFGEPLC